MYDTILVLLLGAACFSIGGAVGSALQAPQKLKSGCIVYEKAVYCEVKP